MRMKKTDTTVFLAWAILVAVIVIIALIILGLVSNGPVGLWVSAHVSKLIVAIIVIAVIWLWLPEN